MRLELLPRRGRALLERDVRAPRRLGLGQQLLLARGAPTQLLVRQLQLRPRGLTAARKKDQLSLVQQFFF